MKEIHIITPVKDSISLTLETIEAILSSDIKVPYRYTVYNDFSTKENTKILAEKAKESGFNLINLSEITTNPSPNYLLILQHAQGQAIKSDAGLLIVESDVIVKKGTIQQLYEGALHTSDCGIAAAVTVDEQEQINYPYMYARRKENQVFKTRKHLSFCCSLLTLNFLRSFDFHQLNPEKNWHDVTISHQSLKEGFQNYLFTTLPVWHRPHSSRPWKQLKYKNPLKYYWLKYTKGLDKI
ncbi:MAG: glycosyltransferase family A protein [Massilibacteroides sp.]|nr:glycosyltransferase family A protein [Massilibacteroides sp.]MDD3062504.1 glycosyltransferase family A protein [Massilibacteroides sp.]MDD4114439.1 glycosyltransferase family A protein [Massilibacteroides sp.]MDD4660350.1 glycosyltransferase family A protein [Massilibacteroides sp.]